MGALGRPKDREALAPLRSARCILLDSATEGWRWASPGIAFFKPTGTVDNAVEAVPTHLMGRRLL